MSTNIIAPAGVSKEFQDALTKLLALAVRPRPRGTEKDAADIPPAPALAVRVPGATKLTGLGRTKIYQAIESGELPAHKDGGVTLILVADLEAYVKNLPRMVPGKFRGKSIT